MGSVIRRGTNEMSYPIDEHGTDAPRKRRAALLAAEAKVAAEMEAEAALDERIAASGGGLIRFRGWRPRDDGGK
jgi:hypothetical protein